MRHLALAALFAAAAVPSIAIAQTPPAATAAHYTTASTDLGTLLDDPAAKAVLAKYIPDIVASEQISMARPMTLKALQGYVGDKLNDKTLASIDADLAKLPAKK